MRQITKITRCKYLPIGLLYLMPLGISSICAAQETAQVPMTATQMDEEFPIPAPKQDSSDSYDLLVMAGKSIDHEAEGPPGAPAISPAEDLRKQRAFIEKNAQSLAMMREALQKPIVPPSGRDFYNLSALSGGGELRSLTRLAMQRNRVAAADKDWDKAINGALDIVQMGVITEKNANVIKMLMSSAIQNMGREDVWDWIEHSDAPTALRAAQRLEKLDAVAPTYADVMREENWTGLSELKGLLVSPEWKAFRGGDDKETAKYFGNEVDIKALHTFSDRDILRHYTQTMDAVIAQAAQPYTSQPLPIPAAADPLSAMTTSLYVTPQKDAPLVPLRASGEMARTGNRLLMVAFALQAFVKDNARYPEKLDELRGKYLQEIPVDPFGHNAPLIYRRQGESYLLYSVNEDGVDGGGTTTEDKPLEGDLVVGKFK